MIKVMFHLPFSFRIFAMVASMLLLNACTTTFPEAQERRDPVERRPSVAPPPVVRPLPRPKPIPRPTATTKPYPSQTPSRTPPVVLPRRPTVLRPADKAESGINPYDNVPQAGGAPRNPSASTSTSSAVKTLLVRAKVDILGARYDASASKLERALRIEPRNAEVWHQLARVNAKQKKYASSITMAQKSNSYTPAGSALEKANWALIKQASKASGDIRTLKKAIQYERFNP